MKQKENSYIVLADNKPFDITEKEVDASKRQLCFTVPRLKIYKFQTFIFLNSQHFLDRL